MKISASAITDKGLKRENNQDSFLSDLQRGVFVVADGMGGHHGGEIASYLSVQNIETYFKTVEADGMLKKPPEELVENLSWHLKEAFRIANSAIQNRSVDQPDLRGMGTTTSMIFFPDVFSPQMQTKLACIGQVGDSRTYFISQNNLWQITKDHSLVQERLRAGLITRAQLKTDRNKNIITRSVGYETKVEADTYCIEAKPGDYFLLCSDGLHGLVDDQEMLDIITNIKATNSTLDQATLALVKLANDRGGDDNVTVILVRVEE